MGLKTGLTSAGVETAILVDSSGKQIMSGAIGNSSTYINVDTTNNKIQIFINGTMVHEWG